MIIRVPLILQPSIAVIYRLDVKSTRNANPPGEDNVGYDETLREPIVYDPSENAPDERTTARKELAPVYVPCQVETYEDERLRELYTGDDPISNIILVFHRKTLKEMGLLDSNNDILLKKGDRVSHLERYGAKKGTIIKTYDNPGLYIFEMRAGSWGFGPDGYDLELAITKERREGALT